MFDRHKRNIEDLNTHLKQSGPAKQPLSAAAYVEEVTRHLARIHRQPAAGVPRRD